MEWIITVEEGVISPELDDSCRYITYNIYIQHFDLDMVVRAASWSQYRIMSQLQ